MRRLGIVLWSVILIRTDVSSMCQDLEVGFLLTEEEHEKRKKSKKTVRVATEKKERQSFQVTI